MAAAVVATATVSPAGAQIRPMDVIDQKASPLELARQMLQPVASPPATFLAEADPIPAFSAPEGDHGYTQAYRSSAGCVVFFFPLGTEEISKVSLRWEGTPAACDGQPLNGEGELLVWTQEGRDTVIRVMRGSFRNGMLHGTGEKANFIYPSGSRTPQSYYLFKGTFENSVLHGEGVLQYVGPPDARPRAYAQQGLFRYGAPTRGTVLTERGTHLIRLQPHEGVEADAYFGMAVQRDGSLDGTQFIPTNLSRMTPPLGFMYMEGDAKPWRVEMSSWKSNQFVAAKISRGSVLIECREWEQDGAKLVCPNGELRDTTGPTPLRVKYRDPIYLNKPRSPDGSIYYPKSRKLLTHTRLPDRREHTYELSCNDAMTDCKTQGPLSVEGTAAYWMGPLSLHTKVLLRAPTASSTLFLRRPPGSGGGKASYPHEAGESPDYAIAGCDRFSTATPTHCDHGRVYFPDGSTLEGEWRLLNVEASTPEKPLPHAYRLTSDAKQAEIVPQGQGWITFASSRRAQLKFDAQGKAVAIAGCKDPSFGRTLNCRIQNGRVVFAAFEGDKRAPSDALPSALAIPAAKQ
jgi:hypothetical protein